MRKSKIKITRQVVTLTFMTLGILMVGSNLNYIIFNSKSISINCTVFPSRIQTAATGEDINVTLHQSYLNTTVTELSNLSKSTVLSVPCPTEPTFNSSYTEIVVENIHAPNKTIIIEDKPTDWQSIDGPLVAATSFEVHSKCYLVNLSTYVGIDDGEDDKCDLVARVLNSTWINGTNEPDDDIAIMCSGGQMSFAHFVGWLNNYSAFFSPILLDPSKTANNTFYIELRDNGLDSDGMSWRIALDNPPTNPDHSLSYIKSGINWTLMETFGDTYDFNLILDLTPIDEIPNPEDIGLLINGTQVTNSGTQGSGFWLPSLELSSDSGNLNFKITADWWDVSCNITKVQINFTKTDLKAITDYMIPEKDLVIWNASINEEINCYDARFGDCNLIIFKVPANWSNIKAFNGSTEKLIDISSPAINGYKDIKVLSSGNGAHWYLTAIVDSRSLGTGSGAISFGNHYLLFFVVGVVILVYFKRNKRRFQEEKQG